MSLLLRLTTLGQPVCDIECIEFARTKCCTVVVNINFCCVVGSVRASDGDTEHRGRDGFCALGVKPSV